MVYDAIFIDINKYGVGHITKRMLPTDAKELVHLTCNRVRVYIYHAKIFIIIIYIIAPIIFSRMADRVINCFSHINDNIIMCLLLGC